MPRQDKQIKFRITPETQRRLDWAMYCERLGTQQEVMQAALAEWLKSQEEKWGPPVEPKVRLKPATPKISGKAV